MKMEAKHQEDITIRNIYMLSIATPKFIQQKPTELKGEINSNSVIVGEFNTPLSSMDKSPRQ